MKRIPLPVGIEDFGELVEKGYYYVDKTWFIKELLDNRGKANLFTRPRRFGKTLNMSMLKYFFELPIDGKSKKSLFENKKIMEASEEYLKEQEQYPVIMLTLKSLKQADYEMAYASLVDEIAKEYDRHRRILEGNRLPKEDKERFQAILNRSAAQIDYAKSLAFLSSCLEKFYDRKVVILLDEYDVPLENAYYGGFYNPMMQMIRSLFESALKTNSSLEFAVITGCLRISKESIFTGLNNLETNSILSVEYDEYFGFTEAQVKEMLSFYGQAEKTEVVKQWYNGYRFGNTNVYNPWSVIMYTKALCADGDAFPIAAWSNTSSNSIVKDLIERAKQSVKMEIEDLVHGKTIRKRIHEDIVYEDVYESEAHLWNFLFFTGYLTLVKKEMEEDGLYGVFAIPNKEVCSIYKDKIRNWFREEIRIQDLSVFYQAVLEGNTDVFQGELNKQLQKSISFMDSKEDFYHGFLLGILGNLDSYIVKSNREAGDGRYDICIRSTDITKLPVIMELKLALTHKQLEERAKDALAEIMEKEYFVDLAEEGYAKVLCYGISFFRKQAVVELVEREL